MAIAVRKGTNAALAKARAESSFSNEIPSVAPEVLSAAPTENVLQQSTLWPERKKMYGHGNELFCVSASPDGALLASAAKGRKAPETDVIVWDAHTLEPVCRLSGHRMTVTRVQFSPDSQLLCSAGRDKGVRLWRRRQEDNTFVACHAELKAHKRIVWDCSWSADGSLLATASRDHTVKLWSVAADGSMRLARQISRSESVTAVCFVGPQLLALGHESGQLSVHDCAEGAQLLALDERECHAGAVKRLRWRHPLLLSGGEDYSVRVTKLFFSS